MPQIHPSEEQNIMKKGFIAFIIIQTIFVFIICAISIQYFTRTNVSTFIPVDMVTLFIAVIILGIILLVVGWSSALNNTTCAWAVFHAFMIVLLLIEIVVCLFTSNFNGYMAILESTWEKSDADTLSEIQADLFCCGLENITDHPAKPCPQNANRGCLSVLQDVLYTIRNAASIAMFVAFTFGLFIDFAGCAICYHPETITLEDHEKEIAMIDGRILEVDAFDNPFAIDGHSLEI